MGAKTVTAAYTAENKLMDPVVLAPSVRLFSFTNQGFKAFQAFKAYASFAMANEGS